MGTPYDPNNPLHNLIVGEDSKPIAQIYDPEANSGQGGMVPVTVNDVQNILAGAGDITDLATLLTNFNAEDFATATKQDAAKAVLDALDNKDFASETTLLALKTAFDNEDFASQTTLAAILSKIIAAPSTEAKQDLIKAVLDSLDGKDYATETKLEATRLLLSSLDGKDFSTETTLASVLAKITELDNKIDSIVDTEGNVRASQYGNTIELRGLLANRMAANAENIVPGETTFWAIDDGWLYASDGAAWHKVLEVGAWQ